jgi:RNA polymerase sigma-70 factor (ECF subfamily)
MRDELVKQAIHHRDSLSAFAYSLLRDWELVEDVLQEAILVVMNKWEEYQEGTSLYAWFRTIVRFKALQAIEKRSKRARPMDEKLLTVISESFQKFQDDDTSDRAQKVRLAMETCMSKAQPTGRQVLTSFYWQKKSSEEIALETGRSPNAVRLALSRVRKFIRECMAKRLEEEGVTYGTL